MTIQKMQNIGWKGSPMNLCLFYYFWRWLKTKNICNQEYKVLLTYSKINRSVLRTLINLLVRSSIKGVREVPKCVFYKEFGFEEQHCVKFEKNRILCSPVLEKLFLSGAYLKTYQTRLMELLCERLLRSP